MHGRTHPSVCLHLGGFLPCELQVESVSQLLQWGSRVSEAETWHFNDLESIQKLDAPTSFYFLLLWKFGCSEPCRIGLFVSLEKWGTGWKTSPSWVWGGVFTGRWSPQWVDTHVRHSLKRLGAVNKLPCGPWLPKSSCISLHPDRQHYKHPYTARGRNMWKRLSLLSAGPSQLGETSHTWKHSTYMSIQN